MNTPTYIDLITLKQRLPELRADFNASSKPFRYVVFDDFFTPEIAEKVYQAYPKIKDGKWDGTTYIDQKNKFQKTQFSPDSLFSSLFSELNAQTFLSWLDELSDFESPLIADKELFGGGLHQSIKGAFLNVHVDYNIHPKTKYHRRLNVLLYMNKHWKDHYQGHLELWDMQNEEKRCLEKIAPSFNRCVIFETNEISFHGHPKPLNTPKEISRKSLATYYYTKTRPQQEIAEEHNTIYVNTEGAKGVFKKLTSGIKAALERIQTGG